MEICDVLLGGRRIGEASWQGSGSRCRVTVRCRYEPDCFYRAILEVDGEPMSLGLLIVRDGSFATERWLTAAQSLRLKSADHVLCRIQRSRMDGGTEPEIQPVQSLQLMPPGIPLDSLKPVTEEITSDPLLRRLITERGDVLHLEDLLAMPAREGEDPMAPFFCLLQPALLGDAPWYLLQLEQGFPVLSQIGQKSPPRTGTMDGVIG